MDTDSSEPTQLSYVVADKAVVDNTIKVTDDQLRTFLQLCWVKYVKARIEPGIPSPIHHNILSYQIMFRFHRRSCGRPVYR